MKTDLWPYKLLLLFAGALFFLAARPFVALQNADRADTFLRLGFTQKAITQYKKALFLMPTYTRAYNQLASVYEETGRKEEAVRTLEKSFEFSPDNKEGYLILGALYAKNKQYEKGRVYLEKALALDPANEVAKAWLFVCNEAMKSSKGTFGF